MKRIFKNLLILMLSSAVILSVTGCGEKTEKVKKYNADSDVKVLASGKVCENDSYSLSWDNEVNCVILTDKTTGESWSSIPYDYYKNGEFVGKAAVSMQSPIDISYYKKGVNQIKEIAGYMGAVRKGRVASEKIKNGIKVTYMFDELEISVPVYYTLNDKSVSVSVIPSEIEEHDNKICEISVSPYFCSTANSKDNYLFVPSGSGALMYSDVRGESPRLYEEEIYGKDLAMQIYEKFENRETVRMSAFGAAGGKSGMLGIVTNGAESASILAQSGNGTIGYSNVYAKFLLRSYNISQVEYSGNEKVKNFWAFADKISPAEKYEVTYYPLSGDNANYSGMAEIYRDYLSDKYSMTDKAEDSLLNLDITGGILVKKFMLGIPYYSVEAATTVEQVKDIISEFSDVSSLDIRLSGFGNSGISAGKVAGGYKLSSVLGNKKQLKELNKYCLDNKIDLYFDYNLLSYNQSGNGFSSANDCIRTVNGYKANQNIFSVSLRNIDETKKEYYIINRESLEKAADKLSDKALLNSVSLSRVGSAVYSDFENYESYNCNGMINAVTEISNKLKENGKTVSFDRANDYAAAVANNITNAPITSSKDNALDIDIPFYQMVFKGNVSISNTAVNYGTDKKAQFLKCVESGTGLTYSLIANYTTDLMETQSSIFVDSLFDDNKNAITDNVKAYGKLFEKVKSAKIKDHIIIDENLRKTVFDNGIEVFVNYGDEAAQYGTASIPQYGFVYTEGR